MKKMVNEDGVIASMCCASCKYFTYKALDNGLRGIKRVCSKKNVDIKNSRNVCGFYAIGKYFKEAGYKPISRKEAPMD